MAQLSCIYLFFNFIINDLNQTSLFLIFRLWDYFFPIVRQNERITGGITYSMANISMPEIILIKRVSAPRSASS